MRFSHRSFAIATRFRVKLKVCPRISQIKLPFSRHSMKPASATRESLLSRKEFKAAKFYAKSEVYMVFTAGGRFQAVDPHTDDSACREENIEGMEFCQRYL
jgi:hypothetical protein